MCRKYLDKEVAYAHKKTVFIINPASAESYKADLLIENGFISDIGVNITPSGSEKVIDADGLTIRPQG
mgnify:CR=1 FL=1